jgi:hypothetical protein
MKLIRVERKALDDGRVGARVQPLDRVGVGLGEGADHDPVRVAEVRERGALGQELRVRDVADVRQAARVEGGAHLLAGADRHGALHHDRRLQVLRQLVDDRPDRREVGVARVGRRRAHGDVEELRALDSLADVEREREPLPVALDHLVEAGLIDRHLAAAQPLDPLRDHVAQDHVVAEVGEACPGDEADVPGAEDRDPTHLSASPYRLAVRKLYGKAVIFRAAAVPSRSRSSSRSRACRAAC